MTTVSAQRVWSPARVVASAAAGLAVLLSAYLTVEHYTHGAGLACPESATVNCAKVTSSSWSVIAGVPVAVGGLVYFVVLTALLLAPTRPVIRRLRLALAGVGLIAVIFLIGVELLSVGAICLWCTGVHVLTLVVFIATLWDVLDPSDGRPAAR